MQSNNKIVILWTSGDKEVAQKMVLMYTQNAKLRGWWEEVTLVIWGPSSKLLSEDVDLQDYVESIKGVGVEVVACKACADEYGITEKLGKLGIDVKYMGENLTNYLKESIKVITF